MELLASYPRARAPLAPEYRAIYAEHYRANRAGLSARLERWMHRQAAAGAPAAAVLEIGAGNLNHVPYEPKSQVYDVVEPFGDLMHGSPYRDRVRAAYRSISEIAPGARYDRIVSVAVLEHLTDLPWIAARCGLLLAPSGRFRAGIPSEGAWLWGLGWRATTAPLFRLRRGLPYGPLMRHEHVSSAREIEAVMRHFFGDVRTRRFPSPLFHLSVYTSIDAGEPHLDRCTGYCESRPLAEAT